MGGQRGSSGGEEDLAEQGAAMRGNAGNREGGRGMEGGRAADDFALAGGSGLLLAKTRQRRWAASSARSVRVARRSSEYVARRLVARCDVRRLSWMAGMAAWMDGGEEEEERRPRRKGARWTTPRKAWEGPGGEGQGPRSRTAKTTWSPRPPQQYAGRERKKCEFLPMAS